MARNHTTQPLNVKLYLETQLKAALQALSYPVPEAVQLGLPKQAAHGDLMSNVALVVAKSAGRKPQEFAHELKATLPDPERIFASVEVAGPGFLNVRFTEKAWQRSLRRVAEKDFFSLQLGHGERILIEYVSANPTGPLHVGNARGGPIGDSLARILRQCGYEVETEYYVNDIGGQVTRLGQSILHWMRVQSGKESQLAEDAYVGEYVQELAEQARHEQLTPEVETLAQWGIGQMLTEIKQDLSVLGCHFDRWCYESQLRAQVSDLIKQLKTKGVTKEAEGALWFINPDNPDDRESVLIRQTGEPTYFADDIVCHVNRYQAGYDHIINIWGANHHGHVPRVRGALQALGFSGKTLEVLLYQYVRVCRGREVVKMSKRAGNYVTAREVLDEVGVDATRFFLLQRAETAHLDFDLTLAREQSAENPIYYIQYAHARIASIQRKAVGEGIPSVPPDQISVETLTLPEEVGLMKYLCEYPDELLGAARERAPHRIAFYLLALARHFHHYYSKARADPRYRVVSTDIDSTQAKLYLLHCVQSVLKAGLGLLGLLAPDEMISPPDEAL